MIGTIQMSVQIKSMDDADKTHPTRWITISLDEYESITHSIEILSDPDLMDQVNKSKRYSEGKDFEELADELGI